METYFLKIGTGVGEEIKRKVQGLALVCLRILLNHGQKTKISAAKGPYFQSAIVLSEVIVF